MQAFSLPQRWSEGTSGQVLQRTAAPKSGNRGKGSLREDGGPEARDVL